MKKNAHLENTGILVDIDDRGIALVKIDLQWAWIQNTYAVYVHVHVHFRELKIGPSVIGMLQGLSACYMACNALILFVCCCKELHEALSSKLHQ